MNNPQLLKELQCVSFSSGASEDGSPKSSHHNSQERINKPLKLDVCDKKWFLASSQCLMGKLKELYNADSSFINKKDFFTGYSALHWASKQDKSELVHWLCDSSADVNLKSHGGYTPLHLAVMSGNATIVDILISDYEADINARDYSGRKPAYYAQSDTPNWMQRALRANHLVDGSRVDPLSSTSCDVRRTNLAVMHSRPISRSFGSFKFERASSEDGNKSNPDQKENREHGSRSRAKSLVQSFRRLRNKDKTRRKEAGEKKMRSDDRSKSVPEVCYTPRSRAKMLQIQHPHLEGTLMADSEEAKAKENSDTKTFSDNDKMRGFEAKKYCDERDSRPGNLDRSIDSNRSLDSNRSIDSYRGVDSNGGLDSNGAYNLNQSIDSNRGYHLDTSNKRVDGSHIVGTGMVAAGAGGLDIEPGINKKKISASNGGFGEHVESSLNVNVASQRNFRTPSPRPQPPPRRAKKEKNFIGEESTSPLKDNNANQWPVGTMV